MLRDCYLTILQSLFIKVLQCCAIANSILRGPRGLARLQAENMYPTDVVKRKTSIRYFGSKCNMRCEYAPYENHDTLGVNTSVGACTNLHKVTR